MDVRERCTCLLLYHERILCYLALQQTIEMQCKSVVFNYINACLPFFHFDLQVQDAIHVTVFLFTYCSCFLVFPLTPFFLAQRVTAFLKELIC